MNINIKQLLEEAKGYVASLESKNDQGMIGDRDIDIINDLADVWYATDISINAKKDVK